jgi:hypothetical protein
VAELQSGEGGPYRTSTFSGGGDCVAVNRKADGTVGVKHSKLPGDLTFTDSEWQAFLKGVKAGEFDSL